MSEIFNDTITQGATYTTTYTLRDANGVVQDWSAWTPKLQLRTDYKDNQATAALTLTSGSGLDITNIATGIIVVTMTAAQTAPLTASYYLHDLKMTNETTVRRVRQGRFIMDKMVTD